MAGNSKLRLYKDGDVLLTKKSLPIKTITQKHKALALQMLQALQEFNGVGLSAVQVGRLLRLIVIKTVSNPQITRIMFNPKILSYDGEPVSRIEGCLSFPGVFKYRSRPESVTVRFQDLLGVEITETFSGLPCQVIIHECFHLDGITLYHNNINNYEMLLYTDSDI